MRTNRNPRVVLWSRYFPNPSRKFLTDIETAAIGQLFRTDCRRPDSGRGKPLRGSEATAQHSTEAYADLDLDLEFASQDVAGGAECDFERREDSNHLQLLEHAIVADH